MGMGHFAGGKKLERNFDMDWLQLASQITEIVNQQSGRNNLVAYVGTDAGQGLAPALYDPIRYEIEVNTEVVFGTLRPEQIGDYREWRTQTAHPRASGAIYHEAMHAKHTSWLIEAFETLRDDEPETLEAMHLLEESRIERLGVRQNKQYRPLLRACTLNIVLSDLNADTLKKLTRSQQAAYTAGLTLARVDAGVLEPGDVRNIRAQILSVFDSDRLERLREVWLGYQGTVDTDLERLKGYARQWVALVKEQARENNESDKQDSFVFIDGGESTGSGDGDGDEQEGGSGFTEALKADEEQAQIGANRDILDAETEAEEARRQRAREERRKEKGANQRQAQQVFGKPNPGPTDGATKSRLGRSRAARPDERAAAITIARELEKAKYRDKEKTAIADRLPPGRLRTRVALQGEAMREMGIDNTVSPWVRQARKQTEEPTLKIGMMADISGSMGRAMEPMAVAAWALSEAVRRVQGQTAMVCYGASVFQTLAPGKHLEQVNVYTAPDAAHEFDGAFRALDGSLDLLGGSGARLLVISSDGQYGSISGGGGRFNMSTDQSQAPVKWLKRCAQEGVGVLWLGFPECNNSNAQEYCRIGDAVYVEIGGSVTDAALRIGMAGAQALTAVGARR